MGHRHEESIEVKPLSLNHSDRMRGVGVVPVNLGVSDDVESNQISFWELPSVEGLTASQELVSPLD